MIVNGITLWEPWASCMALRGADGKPLKQIETRPRRMPARLLGKPLVIHAAKRWTPEQQKFVAELKYNRILRPDWKPMLGQLVCVVTPYSCVRVHWEHTTYSFMNVCGEGYPGTMDNAKERLLGNWEVGRYLYLTKDMRRIKPVPFRGSQCVPFQVPAELIQYEEDRPC